MTPCAIVGSRDFLDERLVQNLVEELPRNSVILTDGVSEVELLVEEAAAERPLVTVRIVPHWTKHHPWYVCIHRNLRLLRLLEGFGGGPITVFRADPSNAVDHLWQIASARVIEPESGSLR